jgi:hypothetical protein
MLVVWAALSSLGCGDNSKTVGPAPLRRLSNTEYKYALVDLFPQVRVALPPLPADSAISGFDNEAQAQQPSDLRIARFEEIANLYADAVTTDAAAVSTLTHCVSWATPSQASDCSVQFVHDIGARIFRRPLTADEQERMLRRFSSWMMSLDFAAAVRLTVSSMLQSPQFLYRAEPATGSDTEAPVEPYAMASRMSFLLWESVPDDELLAAAARGELSTAESIRQQATRMLNDPRAVRLVWDFHRQWLELDRILNEEHDMRTPEIDPSWTITTKASALRESQLFVEQSFLRQGTLIDLLTSRSAWVNPDMARLYNVANPADTDVNTWRETSLDATQRAGLLTRIAFLAGTSHRGGTSPPVRGNALMLRLLCRLPAPPPPGADLSMPIPDPMGGPQTNRQLFEQRTAPRSCQKCHRELNGYGFGFENYSAAGQFVNRDNGLPIDASGRIVGTDVDSTFNGAVDLSTKLQYSRDVYHCAVGQWLRYALGREVSANEIALVDGLADRFGATDGNIRELLLAIVTADTFRMTTAGVSP